MQLFMVIVDEAILDGGIDVYAIFSTREKADAYIINKIVRDEPFAHDMKVIECELDSEIK